MVLLEFDSGTLLVSGPDSELSSVRKWLVYDERIDRYRTEALRYAEISLGLRHAGIEIKDEAKGFGPVVWKQIEEFQPRAHQAHAMRNWLAAGRRGVVVMPTGSGKSYVARLAIQATQRPALILAPTIDLIHQWASQLERCFGCEIGVLGGGQKEIRDITVSTYDSAVLKMEKIGNQFGLIIFDECHHLPGQVYQQAARMSLAPFRLGLTATPERTDGGEQMLDELVGPEIYRVDISELKGTVLAPYNVHRIELSLDPDEKAAYWKYRQIYIDFLRTQELSLQDSDGWVQFIVACARQPGGREAFRAYLEQKRIARAGRSKQRFIWELFQCHPGERIIVFTADNDTAYTIGRTFLLPVITHNTKGSERKQFLDRFRSGEYRILVTSQVLNEGVDVPEASIGIIVSGTGSVREHVQRLGRILRPVRGKQATLYELISRGTAEFFTSERRRQHNAYQGGHLPGM
jgi:superfamily II DNA or RNA helicase